MTDELTELPFSKRRQLNKCETIDYKERDARFRRCCILLDYLFTVTSKAALEAIIAQYDSRDLHHIHGKGTRELRYCLSNAEFKTREKHDAGHAQGGHADGRSADKIARIKSIDFTEAK